MDYEAFKSSIAKGFKDNNICELNEIQIKRFYSLTELLIETNKITNLTAITDPEDIILKHYIDSATVAKHIPSGATVIDVGCGAGFPSLPLAIMRNDTSITSLDSTGKKIAFVEKVSSELGLVNLKAVCARAEEFVLNNREKFDVCVSRAVARLNILSELCLPLVKPEGAFVPMKASNKGQEELNEAVRAISTLGGRLESTETAKLSTGAGEIERELYIIRKIALSPKQYPRKYSQILKKPL